MQKLKTFIYTNIKQFLRFATVGMINTIITISIIFILSNIFNIYYIISNVVGYVAGLINSFIMNKFWTFQSKGNFLKESYWFFVVFLISYILQLMVLYYFHEIVKFNENLSQILSNIFYTLVNFTLNKLLTFR